MDNEENQNRIDDGMMSDDEYTHTQNVVTAICQTLSNLDLAGFRARVDEARYALAADPDLDPDGITGEKLEQVTQVAAHLATLQALVAEQSEGDIARAKATESHIKGVEARHEEGSLTTAEPIIPSDPSFLLKKPEEEQ
jgi:hypothetical protein